MRILMIAAYTSADSQLSQYLSESLEVGDESDRQDIGWSHSEIVRALSGIRSYVHAFREIAVVVALVTKVSETSDRKNRKSDFLSQQLPRGFPSF